MPGAEAAAQTWSCCIWLLENAAACSPPPVLLDQTNGRCLPIPNKQHLSCWPSSTQGRKETNWNTLQQHTPEKLSMWTWTCLSIIQTRSVNHPSYHLELKPNDLLALQQGSISRIISIYHHILNYSTCANTDAPTEDWNTLSFIHQDKPRYLKALPLRIHTSLTGSDFNPTVKPVLGLVFFIHSIKLTFLYHSYPRPSITTGKNLINMPELPCSYKSFAQPDCSSQVFSLLSPSCRLALGC